MIQAMPWLFDCLDVLRFRDRGAKPVWRPEVTNVLQVVIELVLSREREPVRTDTAGLKDGAVLIKATARFIHLA